MTAHYLVHDSYPLQSGEIAVSSTPAQAGSDASSSRWPSGIGAVVFTTVSTPEKAELAASAGADVVINYQDEDFARAVEREAGPRALAAVYDGVGAARRSTRAWA